MISQGVGEQTPFASGHSRTNMPSSGRLFETNTENLLKMVSYCENDVDYRRLLQLIHFGEKFDSFNCRKTCDNCSKSQSYVEKDVTEIAKQLIELVKMTRQQFATSHLLEVYRGSLNQFVKKHRHETLSLHGAGKHLAKGEASLVLRHLVIEDILFEEVKKSDLYGSVSSLVKVNESKVYNILAGGQRIKLRFPSSAKAVKSTPAKGSLASGKQSPPQMENSAQPQPQVDVELSAKVFNSLRMLTANFLKENDFSKHYVFTTKVVKYGDRLLETIEATIKEYYKDKSSSSSNDSGESKRRREAINIYGKEAMNDDFTQSTARSRSKKRLVKKQNENMQTFFDADDQFEEIDFNDNLFDVQVSEVQKGSGATPRVLPSWSNNANGVHG